MASGVMKLELLKLHVSGYRDIEAVSSYFSNKPAQSALSHRQLTA